MKLTVLVVGLLLGSSCDKGETARTGGSSKLQGDDASLLQYLPAGSTALIGGNYMKFQNYLASSPLSRVIASLDKTSPGITEWMKCWVVELPTVTMLGSVKLVPGAAEMRFVMKGIDLAGLEKCANQAKFITVIDPDKKFLSYEMPSAMGPIKGGYLVLPNGALYSRQAIPLVQPMKPSAVDRAGLEADIAALSRGTAEKDTALINALAKLDRSKAMRFAGSGAGTPASAKLGLFSGTMDIANGLAMDVSAELKDKALADKIESGMADAKKSGAQLGGSVGQVINALQVSRKGDTLRFAISISNAQLTAVIDQLAPMFGGALPPN